jgi:hypothetical protein
VSTVPTLQAAASGQPGNAGLVGQFLAAHNTAFVYSGAQVVVSQATGSGVYQSTQAQWLSQTIVTGSSQTVIGSIGLQLSTVGGSPTSALIAPLTVGLYADSGGLPSGSALAAATVSCQYVYGQPFWAVIPLSATVTASTQYHLVTNLVGTSGHYYVWQQSNQTTGAATAPDGVTWTQQPYGLMYEVLDQTASGQLLAISEDNGAVLTSFTYNSLGQIATVTQFATTQSGGSISSSGTLSYTSGLLTGVS